MFILPSASHYVPPQKIQKILHEKIEISPSFTRQNIEQTLLIYAYKT
jgi:hypothetical protein